VRFVNIYMEYRNVLKFPMKIQRCMESRVKVRLVLNHLYAYKRVSNTDAIKVLRLFIQQTSYIIFINHCMIIPIFQ
jgi:hypothetical protein